MAYEEEPTGLTAQVKAQLAALLRNRPVHWPGDREDQEAQAHWLTARSEAEAAAERSAGSLRGNPRQQSGADGAGSGQLAIECAHRTKSGTLSVKTRVGSELSYGFDGRKGRMPGAVREWAGAHCRVCLGPHRNEECQRPSRPAKGGGKGGNVSKFDLQRTVRGRHQRQPRLL